MKDKKILTPKRLQAIRSALTLLNTKVENGELEWEAVASELDSIVSEATTREQGDES